MASQLDPSNYLLSVIVPAYNDRFTIRELIRRVMNVPVPKEVIVVDDASTDGTTEVLDELKKIYSIRMVRHEHNQGKGAAIQTGIKEAKGDFIVIQDADLEYDPNEYPVLLQPLLSGEADVVYGSRFMSGPRRVHLYWHMIGNRLLTSLCNVLCNLNLSDMESCYKVFRSDIIKSISLSSKRFGFEPEVTMKLAKLRCVFYEVPISYHGRTYEEGKKIGFKDAVEAFFVILKNWIMDDLGCIENQTLVRMAQYYQYNRSMFQQIQSHLGTRVLEIGSGIGNISKFLIDRPLTLLSDINPVYLRILKRRFGIYENVIIHYLDVNSPDVQELRKHRLDTVLCLNVLEHIQKDDDVLTHFYEILESQGQMILLVPAHPSLFSTIDKNLGHVRRYNREELEAKIRRAGFQIVAMEYFNWIGAVGWWFSGKVLHQSKITSMSKWGFRLLKVLGNFGRIFRNRFGLSLIAVAKKHI